MSRILTHITPFCTYSNIDIKHNHVTIVADQSRCNYDVHNYITRCLLDPEADIVDLLLQIVINIKENLITYNAR